MRHGLKEETKDIDLVVPDGDTFRLMTHMLIDAGFRSETPGNEYERMEIAHILVKGDVRIDLFNRSVCRKLSLSPGMIGRP